VTSRPGHRLTDTSFPWEENPGLHIPRLFRPPAIKKVRHACHASGAIVAIKVRNPNRVELSFMVQLSAGPNAQEAQAVTLPGMPNGEYLIELLDYQGGRRRQADGASRGVPARRPRPGEAQVEAAPVGCRA
jgi:hypothetical protein